jgi:ribose transport system ATP-binding protein
MSGASVFGGSGSVLAIAVGGILLATIAISLASLSISVYWQYWLQGLFVLLATVELVSIRFRKRTNRNGFNR